MLMLSITVGNTERVNYVGTDYYGFFLTVSRIIVNSQYQEEIRKLGATVLKNLLKSEEDIKKQEKKFEIDIKQELISQLLKN